MTNIENQTIKKYINKDGWIIVNKTYVITTSKFKQQDGYIEAEYKGVIYNINLQDVHVIKYDKKKDIYSISYNIPNTIKGILSGINSKFIEISIHNTRDNKYYDVVIPIKNIQGIKFTEVDI